MKGWERWICLFLAAIVIHAVGGGTCALFPGFNEGSFVGGAIAGMVYMAFACAWIK